MDLDTLRRTPAYTFAEAAHYLGIPVSTLRAWFVGTTYGSKPFQTRFRQIITLDGDGLSFLNLVEAHVLAAIRRTHRVPMLKVREALTLVARQFKTERPLIDISFETDGLNLFVLKLGELINVSQAGQLAIAEVMKSPLRRIQRDEAGVPVRLFLFTRSGHFDDAQSPISVDPRFAFGRPALVGRAVPTAVIADRFKAGDSLSELASDFDTDTGVIEEAIRCELEREAA